MDKKILVLVTTLWLLVFTVPAAEAQQKYWIYLNDKNSDFDANVWEEELPKTVQFESIQIEPVVYSKWLKAFSAELEYSEVQSLRKLDQIDSVVSLSNRYVYASVGDPAPKIQGYALEQIDADAFLSRGYRGQGIKIGIIDAGFFKANKQKSLRPIIDDDRLKGYRNYIDGDRVEPFRENDSHGTRVWNLIAGYSPSSGVFQGMAPDAEYLIARTDEDPAEYRAEEDFWIAALEWMHEEGVQIIHSSLGYSDGHDDPAEDYLPEQADGKSTALTQVVNIAVFEKGLLVIMSAGNSGNENFEVINIPADSPGVLAVGATNMKFWTKQDYSSIGRYTYPLVKPDVACYSASGTSFSAPVITGLAACIMQADTTLTNLEVASIIRKSSHLRYFPNNYLGYGVPNARRALDMIENSWEMEENSGTVYAESDEIEIQVIARNPVLFHKLNDTEVKSQRVIQRHSERWKVIRPSAEIRVTTFATRTEAIEIIWPEG